MKHEVAVAIQTTATHGTLDEFTPVLRVEIGGEGEVEGCRNGSQQCQGLHCAHATASPRIPIGRQEAERLY